MDFCILQRIIKVEYAHDTIAREANINTWATYRATQAHTRPYVSTYWRSSGYDELVVNFL